MFGVDRVGVATGSGMVGRGFGGDVVGSAGVGSVGIWNMKGAGSCKSGKDESRGNFDSELHIVYFSVVVVLITDSEY